MSQALRIRIFFCSIWGDSAVWRLVTISNFAVVANNYCCIRCKTWLTCLLCKKMVGAMGTYQQRLLIHHHCGFSGHASLPFFISLEVLPYRYNFFANWLYSLCGWIWHILDLCYPKICGRPCGNSSTQNFDFSKKPLHLWPCMILKVLEAEFVLVW